MLRDTGPTASLCVDGRKYRCPRCKNIEHPNGANFCKICGLKID